MRKDEPFMVPQINEEIISPKILGQWKDITVWSTNRSQCCLTLGVLMGTKFTDGSTTGLLCIKLYIFITNHINYTLFMILPEKQNFLVVLFLIHKFVLLNVSDQSV